MEFPRKKIVRKIDFAMTDAGMPQLVHLKNAISKKEKCILTVFPELRTSH
jgi:hypothetical protein